MGEFIAIPSITVLCYLAAELYKALVPSDLYKHIPVLCGLVGALLGLVGHFFLPGFPIAENAISAAAVGAISGWAATGANQTVKKERKQ
ncbi:MAG: phage holin family protein [Oscillospiraceae bacterium]